LSILASKPSPKPADGPFHGLFEIAIWLKGLNGLAELVAGIVLVVLGPRTLEQFVLAVSSRELSEDPNDLFANLARRIVAGLGHDGEAFAAIYLLLHGVIKLVLAVCLLRGKTSAFPVASAFFAIFIAYMGYRLALHWSWVLLALVAIDLATLALVLREWHSATTRAERRA
jgi:uncharacterized membrane protein